MRRAKRKNPWDRRRVSDRGQITILVVIALAVFLLGFVGFAVDMTNLWFHRQMAQGAADAACQAGIMNVLVHTDTQGFTPGTPFDCAGSAATPCKYAALNGYNGSGLAANASSNAVAVSFPGTPAGYDPTILPPTGLAPFPFLRVDVTDRVKVFFSPLITGNLTQDVHAQAICGLTLQTAPVPIIVLNPTCTHPFEVSGSATLTIVGGPVRSVQVNSANQDCAAASAPSQCDGGGRIDLSAGGPTFSGSQFGVFGAPSAAPSNFMPGTTGSWANTSPISDPFITVPPPDVPTQSLTDLPPNGTGPLPELWSGAGGTHGCPDHSNCVRYLPGLYQKPIVVDHVTAIFEPGVYYIAPASNMMDLDNCGTPGNGCVARPTGQCSYDFAVGPNGIVRPSNDTTTNGGGTMFYLSGSGTGARPYGSVFFGANAGNPPGGHIVDNYNTSNVSCDGTLPDPRVGVPSTVPGNVLVGQCAAGGTYLGPPSTDTAGNVRGLLFFGDRNNGTNGTYLGGQPSMQGGGGLLLSGSLYFTNCPGWGAGPCSDPPAGYNAFLQLQGTPGSGTFVLGNITTDELVEAGNGAVAMHLNPNAIYFILKATLVR